MLKAIKKQVKQLKGAFYLLGSILVLFYLVFLMERWMGENLTSRMFAEALILSVIVSCIILASTAWVLRGSIGDVFEAEAKKASDSLKEYRGTVDKTIEAIKKNNEKRLQELTDEFDESIQELERSNRYLRDAIDLLKEEFVVQDTWIMENLENDTQASCRVVCRDLHYEENPDYQYQIAFNLAGFSESSVEYRYLILNQAENRQALSDVCRRLEQILIAMFRYYSSGKDASELIRNLRGFDKVTNCESIVQMYDVSQEMLREIEEIGERKWAEKIVSDHFKVKLLPGNLYPHWVLYGIAIYRNRIDGKRTVLIYLPREVATANIKLEDGKKGMGRDVVRAVDQLFEEEFGKSSVPV